MGVYAGPIQTNIMINTDTQTNFYINVNAFWKCWYQYEYIDIDLLLKVIVYARTDPKSKPAHGITAFIVEEGFPGFQKGINHHLTNTNTNTNT